MPCIPSRSDDALPLVLEHARRLQHLADLWDSLAHVLERLEAAGLLSGHARNARSDAHYWLRELANYEVKRLYIALQEAGYAVPCDIEELLQGDDPPPDARTSPPAPQPVTPIETP